jgi:hypothetical protein
MAILLRALLENSNAFLYGKSGGESVEVRGDGCCGHR